MSKPEIIARECRFAIHVPSKHPDESDVHYVKEQIHYADGTSEPNVRIFENYKRPFYITKPSKRTHKQKKEWEDLDNLAKKECTQSNLRFQIAKALEKPWSKETLRDLSMSPYLYGTDITSTALIKRSYMKKWSERTPYTLAAFDIETDMLNGTNDPIIVSAIYQDKCYVSVLKSFISGTINVEEKVLHAANTYIKEYVEKHNLKIEIYLADDLYSLINEPFKKLHEWKPDFLAIWNMNFDLPVIINTLKKIGVDPADVLCDPTLPKNFRLCRYKEGNTKKITASGKVMPINPANQWHTFFLTASFYCIDAMCSYRYVRLSNPEEPSYKLDKILDKELGIRKLTFKEADAYTEGKWHQFMQSNFKIEYIVYNIFDSLSMLELEAKTKDLSFTLPSDIEFNDFHVFNSGPKRIAGALYDYGLDRGVVMAATGNKKEEGPVEEYDEDGNLIEDESSEEDEDKEPSTLSLKNWIDYSPLVEKSSM